MPPDFASVDLWLRREPSPDYKRISALGSQLEPARPSQGALLSVRDHESINR